MHVPRLPRKGFFMKNYKDKTVSAKVKLAVWLCLSAVFVAGAFYVTLPALNIHAGELWRFVFICAAFIAGGDIVINGLLPENASAPTPTKRALSRLPKRLRLALISAAVLLCVLIILGIFSSQLLRSGSYSSMIELKELDFSDAIEESEHVSDIALMDSASAVIIGNRTLGSLSDLVSQFTIAEDYTQIALNGTPTKVAPLEYASFFKWLGNRRDGIPGYVKVDPVGFDAEFVRLPDGEYIKYSPSAYFGKKLERALRFAYPFEIFGNISFETDESGRPYWICRTLEPRAGFFGGYDVSGAVVFDAATGESEYYETGSVPEWVDIVYDGDLICRKYDWYGSLSGGYFNYMFSQTGCSATTEDFGYKIIGNDVYIYTGVTSLSNDEANIGFILVNSRTGEYSYIALPGAEEFSAMASAEGALQQYGYEASFPSLVNICGEPTYIMVLKDASGIVKMYAMVNVRNYNTVVTSDSQEELLERYIAAAKLESTPSREEADTASVELVVKERYIITEGGESVVYLLCEDDAICSLPFSPELLRVDGGDRISLSYTDETDGIYNGVSFEVLE